MKIGFIGVGSIALRHIRNLRELYGSDIYITALRSGKGKVLNAEEETLINNVVHRYEEMASDYDAIFVTNPTSMHYETLENALEMSDSFFIEKPVFDTGDEDYHRLEQNEKIFYVACPYRYSNVICYLKQNIDFSSVYAIRCICSSYLPEWRAGVDYKKVYSTSRRLGGGVSIDLIHEWDYLTYLLGFPEKVSSIIAKKSDLEIDSDDIAVYIAEYPNTVAEIHLDYFGRQPIRTIEIFMKHDTLICNLLTQKIVFAKKGVEINMAEERDDFQKKELLHFMKIVNGEIQSDNNLANACKTLRLAKGNL